MSRAEIFERVAGITAAWLDDPHSDVVWAGEFEGRLGVRVAQRVRDFTTIWFDVGDRTLAFEAYVLPAPPEDAAEVYRQCLFRNHSSWRVHFAIDRDGDVYLRGRMPVADVSADTLDEVLGAFYEQVEISFRGLVRAGFHPREKSS